MLVLFVTVIGLWLVANPFVTDSALQSCEFLYENSWCQKMTSSDCKKERPSTESALTVRWVKQHFYSFTNPTCGTNATIPTLMCSFCNASFCARTITNFSFDAKHEEHHSKFNTVVAEGSKEAFFPFYDANGSKDDFIALKEFHHPVIIGRQPNTSQFDLLLDSINNSWSMICVCFICAALFGAIVWLFVSVIFFCFH